MADPAGDQLVGRAGYRLAERPTNRERGGAAAIGSGDPSSESDRARGSRGSRSAFGSGHRAGRVGSEPRCGLVTRSGPSAALEAPDHPGLRVPGRSRNDPERGGRASSGEVRAKRDRHAARIGRAKRERARWDTRAETSAENDHLSSSEPKPSASGEPGHRVGRFVRAAHGREGAGPRVTVAKKRSGELGGEPTPRS